MNEAQALKMMEKYEALRTKRLAIEKEAESIKAEESMLRSAVQAFCMGRLDKHGVLFQPKGAKVKAEIKMVAEADVFDWPELQKHILATGEFDLLQKRATVTAVRQRWEVGKQVPGIRQVQTPVVTISKVKE